MVKVVSLISRKPGLSREAFAEYYESHHVPLAMRLLPVFIGYSRNYVQPAAVADDAGYAVMGEAGGFDVISEFWFSDRAAFDECFVLMARPDIRAQITEDEERFMDRSKTRIYIVDERVTEIGHL
jgi:uncharacterized protein (TIGR02118 family)